MNSDGSKWCVCVCVWSMLLFVTWSQLDFRDETKLKTRFQLHIWEIIKSVLVEKCNSMVVSLSQSLSVCRHIEKEGRGWVQTHLAQVWFQDGTAGRVSSGVCAKYGNYSMVLRMGGSNLTSRTHYAQIRPGLLHKSSTQRQASSNNHYQHY